MASKKDLEIEVKLLRRLVMSQMGSMEHLLGLHPSQRSNGAVCWCGALILRPAVLEGEPITDRLRRCARGHLA